MTLTATQLDAENIHIQQIATEGGAQVAGDVHADTFVGRDLRVYQQSIHTHAPAQPVDGAMIEAARAKLAELPVKSIPERTALPAGSWMPVYPNPGFVGRIGELKRVAKALKADTVAVAERTVVVTGWGGVGKTQLASAFVHHYGAYFAGGVYWISMANAENVASEIVQSGQRGMPGLPGGFAHLRLDVQVQAVCAAWQSPLPRLLIFDNCEDPALLQQWSPTTGGCRILVTSRRASWPPFLVGTVLAIPVLKRRASLALLKQFCATLPGLDAICEELGDLPLALHIAGSYLQRMDRTPEQYLALLKGENPLANWALRGASDEPSPTGHVQHVARTFALSYEQLNPLDATDDLAADLLTRLSTFALGEWVPRFLLLLTAGIPEIAIEDGQLEITAQESIWRQGMEALQRLDQLGLITVNGREAEVATHRLVASFVQSIDSTGERLEASQMTEGMLLSLAQEINASGYPRLLLPWQNHLRHVVDQALRRRDRQAATLANTFGFHLREIGDYAAAKPYLERALAIREAVLGSNHPHTALSYNNLGTLLKDMGEPAAAKPYYERALAIREAVLGSNHPHTAQSYNNLGTLLHAMGEPAAAKPYLERALAICEAVLGSNHPHTQVARNNLDALIKGMGEP